MLTYLIIRNFAIIDSLEMEFPSGFTVLTGETGAGKSIIINALNLILGGRASADVIRADTDRAVVEATFSVEGERREEIEALLREQGIEAKEELFIRRVVHRQGKNKAFVNGSLVGSGTLRALTRGLVDISGQHEHYSLMEPENHLGILDRFGGLNARSEALGLEIARMHELKREVKRLKNSERERLSRMDYLSFQLEEIDRSLLSPQQKAKMEEEQGRLRHAERLRDETGQLSRALYEDNHSVADALGDACASLGRLLRFDASLSSIADMLDAARIQLNEAGSELRQYTRGVEVNPERLEEIGQSLHAYAQLTRRYGDNYDEILRSGDEMRAELYKLKGTGHRIGEAEAELVALRREVMAEARTLSALRHEAARRLEASVESELGQLNMARCQIRVEITHRDEQGGVLEDLDRAGVESLGERGLDFVEVMFCPNPGEGFKPLARVASGGELSRVMLAIKNGLLSSDPVSTLVFDEVDTGIGGITADIVGEKIRGLSRSKQVLCITHLPQIAAYADHHLRVEKVLDAERTTSTLRHLGEVERVREVARMLGGRRCTEKTLAHAAEMIARSGPARSGA
jgi:DNA repair protein RecN (Recombination protein N)